MSSLRLNAIYGSAQTIVIVAYALVFVFDSGPRLFAGTAWSGLGTGLCVAGLLLMALAFGVLWPVVQIAPQPREDGRLITSGVYSRLRHPMYTGIVIITVGLFLRKGTAAVAVATIVVAGFLVFKSAYEERLLAARYPEYAQYRRSTTGVIPFLT